MDATKQKCLQESKMLTYSIGEMIDKLAVIHLKIWHLEELIDKVKSSEDPYETEWLEKKFDQVVSLNKKRMEIVSAIDEYFSDKQ